MTQNERALLITIGRAVAMQWPASKQADQILKRIAAIEREDDRRPSSERMDAETLEEYTERVGTP